MQCDCSQQPCHSLLLFYVYHKHFIVCSPDYWHTWWEKNQLRYQQDLQNDEPCLVHSELLHNIYCIFLALNYI